MHIGYWPGSQKEIAHQDDQDIHESITLERFLQRYDVVVLIGLFWLRIGSSRGLFWTL
jgi:hypothetical protein